ncbi:uncharacterized protein LOC127723014 [Mytilus californianus]|uniref:uncharacterized protein LOC127723014 n=1 Tax=Mytilus californianus TaxID=6549 RepID=UPI002246231D|nr:uncharacterized protein LOC127723014 [Mytilus californianus]
MNGKSTNQDNCDDGYPFGMKKTTYWEIYSVKCFPYRGRRKYTPLLNQSLDGGLIISNDVFGLTIRQFDRMYKACLHRRKTQEQWILNLRYPDKSSKDYLEYLQNCTDSNKNHLHLLGNNPWEKYLYERLITTIGTEIDIRNRQRLFLIHDMIGNACSSPDLTNISSGSLAEGLDLPGSDFDKMFVLNQIEVIRNVRQFKPQIYRTTYVMETDFDHPGFTRLKIVAEQGCRFPLIQSACVESIGKGWYASVNLFLDSFKQRYKNVPIFSHGPCLSDQRQTIDHAYCLRSKYLPHNAMPWASRHRCQWPPNFVIDRIMNYGCLLVPIGPKTVSDNDLLWRVSFSVAEKKLVHSFNFTQLLCYGLLKLTLKRIINTHDEVQNLLCSYFLKTALFWVSEEVDINTFQIYKLFHCFSLCLDKLKSWVNICYCPNYFIPEHNMFLGKINKSNNMTLLAVLESIKCGGINGLVKNLFPNTNENHNLLRTKSESSFILLDILLYRITGTMRISTDISLCFEGLAFTKSLVKYESSSFIIDVCKYYYAKISTYVAQLLPPPNTIVNPYDIHKLYHRHLQECIDKDAVSGWLLYASFYYVTGQYTKTLGLIDYIMSKCVPHMLLLGLGNYSKVQINMYSHCVHSKMSLHDKIKTATVSSVLYLQNSSLIPKELQLEVKEGHVLVMPIEMSLCLRFLCYHHLGDISSRQHTLRHLYFLMKSSFLFPSKAISVSLTILGVCFEVSGDKNMAYECYDKALQCGRMICSSAEIRKSTLT